MATQHENSNSLFAIAVHSPSEDRRQSGTSPRCQSHSARNCWRALLNTHKPKNDRWHHDAYSLGVRGIFADQARSPSIMATQGRNTASKAGGGASRPLPGGHTGFDGATCGPTRLSFYRGGVSGASTRNHWSPKRALSRFWWTSHLVQRNGLSRSVCP